MLYYRSARGFLAGPLLSPARADGEPVLEDERCQCGDAARHRPVSADGYGGTRRDSQPRMRPKSTALMMMVASEVARIACCTDAVIRPSAKPIPANTYENSPICARLSAPRAAVRPAYPTARMTQNQIPQFPTMTSATSTKMV